jgi:hypothetical protein
MLKTERTPSFPDGCLCSALCREPESAGLAGQVGSGTTYLVRGEFTGAVSVAFGVQFSGNLMVGRDMWLLLMLTVLAESWAS